MMICTGGRSPELGQHAGEDNELPTNRWNPPEHLREAAQVRRVTSIHSGADREASADGTSPMLMLRHGSTHCKQWMS